MEKEIAAAMATRDLMSAIVTLSDLPADVVRLEFIDLELAQGRLSALLDKIYDRDTVRRLRREQSHAA